MSLRLLLLLGLLEHLLVVLERLGVVLEGFSFLGSGNRGEGGAPSDAPRSRSAPVAAPAVAAPASGADDSGPPSEDDVPF